MVGFPTGPGSSPDPEWLVGAAILALGRIPVCCRHPARAFSPVHPRGNSPVSQLQCGSSPLHHHPSIGQREPEFQLRFTADPFLSGTLLLREGPAPDGYPGMGGLVNDGCGDLGQAVPGVYCERELNQTLSGMRNECSPTGKPAHYDRADVST